MKVNLNGSKIKTLTKTKHQTKQELEKDWSPMEQLKCIGSSPPDQLVQIARGTPCQRTPVFFQISVHIIFVSAVRFTTFI